MEDENHLYYHSTKTSVSFTCLGLNECTGFLPFVKFLRIRKIYGIYLSMDLSYVKIFHVLCLPSRNVWSEQLGNC